MIEMTVDRVATDPNNRQRIVWLRTLKGHVMVPIVIGEGEAFSIALGLAEQEAPRPLSHDLMHSILDQLNASVEKVEILEMKDGTFFAELVLSGDDGSVSIDARPSDCLALAVRAGAPIYVSQKLLEAEGVVVEPEESLIDPETEEEMPEIPEMSSETVDTAIQDLIASTGLAALKEEISDGPEARLRQLKWRLDLAVRDEDYERAAKIRDEIYEKETKQGAQMSGP